MVEEAKANNNVNTYNIPGIDKILPPGMLSSPQIAYCIDKLKIIINADLDDCLDSATYHMRIGGDTLTWKDGKKEEFFLDEVEDRSRNIINKIILRPNSLTFVTTIEKFNLPKDIIARFNLKSKLIHQGLLLGTGPIVDPQLNAQLLIPLHNFSNHDIELKWKQKIISVEFTKTMNPDSVIPQKNGRKYIFVENEHWDFNFHKYRERIGQKTVESSVSSAFDKYGKMFEKYKESMARFSWIGGFTALGTGIALIVLVFTTWMLLDTSFQKLDDASNLVKQYEDQNVDFRSFALAKDQEKLKKIAEKNEVLSENAQYKLDQLSRSNIKNAQFLQKQIDALQNKINELQSLNKKNEK